MLQKSGNKFRHFEWRSYEAMKDVHHDLWYTEDSRSLDIYANDANTEVYYILRGSLEDRI
jgi:hypothetical protein